MPVFLVRSDTADYTAHEAREMRRTTESSAIRGRFLPAIKQMDSADCDGICGDAGAIGRADGGWPPYRSLGASTNIRYIYTHLTPRRTSPTHTRPNKLGIPQCYSRCQLYSRTAHFCNSYLSAVARIETRRQTEESGQSVDVDVN